MVSSELFRNPISKDILNIQFKVILKLNYFDLLQLC